MYCADRLSFRQRVILRGNSEKELLFCNNTTPDFRMGSRLDARYYKVLILAQEFKNQSRSFIALLNLARHGISGVAIS
jgi:hypothetical protein